MRIYSQRQARLFGAMIGGKAKNPKGLTDKGLKSALRGKKVSKLPLTSSGGKKKR